MDSKRKPESETSRKFCSQLETKNLLGLWIRSLIETKLATKQHGLKRKPESETSPKCWSQLETEILVGLWIRSLIETKLATKQSGIKRKPESETSPKFWSQLETEKLVGLWFWSLNPNNFQILSLIELDFAVTLTLTLTFTLSLPPSCHRPQASDHLVGESRRKEKLSVLSLSRRRRYCSHRCSICALQCAVLSRSNPKLSPIVRLQWANHQRPQLAHSPVATWVLSAIPL